MRSDSVVTLDVSVNLCVNRLTHDEEGNVRPSDLFIQTTETLKKDGQVNVFIKTEGSREDCWYLCTVL